jgi:transcriptional repressor NrdR
MVIKRSGRRVLFDRGKIERSVALAVRKRPIEGDEAVERMISGVVRQLESCGEPEVTTVQIGELLMAGLKVLDSVAYVRFASVYCDFNEVHDFYRLIAQLGHSDFLEAEERLLESPSRDLKNEKMDFSFENG